VKLSALAVVLALVSCAREQHASVVVDTTTPATSASTTPPSSAKRCLPVVSDDCKCTYSCGTGTETSPGKWSVSHPFWGQHPLDAKIAPWCVAGDCTDAFHAQIVCDGVCAPKPADHTCHFEGDRCVGAAKP
jgi:hypothetical protein